MGVVVGAGVGVGVGVASCVVGGRVGVGVSSTSDGVGVGVCGDGDVVIARVSCGTSDAAGVAGGLAQAPSNTRPMTRTNDSFIIVILDP